MKVGQVIFYDDAPHPGYPIRIRDGMTHIAIGGKFKGMGYRCQEFMDDNKHLKCTLSEIPATCEYLHEFQEWYESIYGEIPPIYQNGTLL